MLEQALGRQTHASIVDGGAIGAINLNDKFVGPNRSAEATARNQVRPLSRIGEQLPRPQAGGGKELFADDLHSIA